VVVAFDYKDQIMCWLTHQNNEVIKMELLEAVAVLLTFLGEQWIRCSYWTYLQTEFEAIAIAREYQRRQVRTGADLINSPPCA